MHTGADLTAGGLGRAGAQFLFLFALLVLAAGVLASVIVVVAVGGAQVEGVQDHAHDPGVDLHQQLRGPPRARTCSTMGEGMKMNLSVRNKSRSVNRSEKNFAA